MTGREGERERERERERETERQRERERERERNIWANIDKGRAKDRQIKICKEKEDKKRKNKQTTGC